MPIQTDDSSAGKLTLKGGASGDYTITFPTANASGALTNNGSGTLTWAAGGGGGTPAAATSIYSQINFGGF